MKEKLILYPNKCQALTYTNYNIFTCFYKKNNTSCIEQIDTFVSCRELLIYSMLKIIKDIEKKKLRLLMSTGNVSSIKKKETMDKIKLGCKMANIVSKQYKMQPVIYKSIECEEKFPIIKISASPKWQRSPQMISLFLLFIKYCSTIVFSDVKTYDQLMKKIDNNHFLSKDLMIDSKKITLFLNNYTKFFKTLPIELNYRHTSYEWAYKSSIQYEGITYLFNNLSKHKILKKKFTKLLSMEKLK